MSPFFPEPYVLLAFPKITILFPLHSCYKFLNIAEKKRNHTSIKHRVQLLIKEKKKNQKTVVGRPRALYLP